VFLVAGVPRDDRFEALEDFAHSLVELDFARVAPNDLLTDLAQAFAARSGRHRFSIS
jgi:hypothetical protein